MNQVFCRKAAGKEECNKQQFVIVIGVGLKLNQLHKKPYERRTCKNLTILTVQAKECRKKKQEYPAPILNIEPEIGIRNIGPVKMQG